MRYKFMNLKRALLLVSISIAVLMIFYVGYRNAEIARVLQTEGDALQTSELISQTDDVVESIISFPIADFSCQPNECQMEIETGINNIAYPSCNPVVQINNTGASNKNACDYWRNQQKYFGTEDYVNLSQMSKDQKAFNREEIVDGFLGIESDIQVHRNAAIVFLKAESKFNELYGATRQGSTYYLPSYPKGYKFEFSGSLVKRAVRGTTKNEDGLLYQGEYITPSNHFWGAAIDFNSPDNFGNRFGAKCSINIPPELVMVFESNGLRWGGRFFSDTEDVKYFDPMHFEVVPGCVDDRKVDLGI